VNAQLPSLPCASSLHSTMGQTSERSQQWNDQPIAGVHRMSLASSLLKMSGSLKRNLQALYLAYRDPRVPVRAKVLIAALMAYAASPVDLIPDFIPVLGYLDDLILLPIGVSLAIKMIPKDVLSEYMDRARTQGTEIKRKNWPVAFLIILLWAITIVFVARGVWQHFFG